MFPGTLLKKKSSRNSPADSICLDGNEEFRFQDLRKWRKAKATELDIPAFVIFGDQTLKELAKQNPQSLDQLKGIYGIGEAKLEKFGPDLLNVLRNNI